MYTRNERHKKGRKQIYFSKYTCAYDSSINMHCAVIMFLKQCKKWRKSTYKSRSIPALSCDWSARHSSHCQSPPRDLTQNTLHSFSGHVDILNFTYRQFIGLRNVKLLENQTHPTTTGHTLVQMQGALWICPTEFVFIFSYSQVHNKIRLLLYLSNVI